MRGLLNSQIGYISKVLSRFFPFFAGIFHLKVGKVVKRSVPYIQKNQKNVKKILKFEYFLKN